MQTYEGLVRVDGGALHYEIAGQGQPVVLSHAGFLDSRMFDDLWLSLAPHFQVIRYDMRGFGRSGAASGPICRRHDLRAVLDHLGIRRAHLVGCSIGGELVLDLALEEPSLALSLTLIGAVPSGFELQGEPPPYLLEMYEALGAGNHDLASELQLRIWLDGLVREPGQVNQMLRERAAAMNRVAVERNTLLIADSQPVCPLSPPAVRRLSEIVCPALIVVGALDHPEIQRAANVMAEGIADARLLVVPDAGHVPTFEQPETLTRELLAYFAESRFQRSVSCGTGVG